jgi:hypothetical protein
VLSASGGAGLRARVEEATGARVLLLPVRACRTSRDLTLALGQATDATPAGDEQAVGAALRAMGPVVVVLEGGACLGLRELWLQLRSLAPSLRWVGQGPVNPLEEEGVFVLGPVAVPGEPSPGPDVDPPWALLHLARGAAIPAGLRWESAVDLRALGELVTDPDRACEASAAAARLFAAWGQLDVSRALLEAARRRNPGASAEAQGLLSWAEADALLLHGEVDSGELHYGFAADRLREAGSLALLARLHHRRAHRLALAGRARAAHGADREARALFREGLEPTGVAETLRAAADRAVAAGESLSAETLYDQAEGYALSGTEQAQLRLGQAALALSRGELGQAAERLREAAVAVEQDGGAGSAVLRASIHHRRAELHLRQGQHPLAVAEATQAMQGYRPIGELGAMGASARLLGDIGAASGQIGEAARWYRIAVAWQVRVQDPVGLRRTLLHASALEDELGDRLLGEQHARDADAFNPEEG